VAEVDAFLDRAARALDERRNGQPQSLTPDDVLAARFHTTTSREGYDQDEIDDLLDEVVEALKA
jgi:DivIVA domain-containing protein